MTFIYTSLSLHVSFLQPFLGYPCFTNVGRSLLSIVLHIDNRYEGGDDDMGAVECWCGAKEDDGERMMACDVCATWHHTRCVGVTDDKEIPSMFLCTRCGGISPDAGETLVPWLDREMK